LPLGNVRAAAPLNASIVIDSQTGQVLSQSNADLPTYPASLTKMMTLYLAFEALQKGRIKLDQSLPVSANAANEPPTKLGLRAGGTVTVAQAIRGMIIKSANDAAVVMAEALGGSVEGFAQKMNAKAQALGMTRSYFRNPNGLPDPDQHVTARDLARLALALYRDFPQYYPLFSETHFTFQGRTYLTHNRFVLSYPGADGLKTGYINASGYNLAASATRNGRRIVGIVLGGRSASLRDAQMWALLDQGFGTKTPADSSNTLMLANTPGVFPSLKPNGEVIDGSAEDDTLEDGTPAPVVAAANAALGSRTITGKLPTTGLSLAQLSTPSMFQLQVLQPAIAAQAEPTAVIPLTRPDTRQATKIKPALLKLAAVTPPPQLRPQSAGHSTEEGEGVTDGVLPLAVAPNRYWGVQVGAYSRYAPAQQLAVRAQEALPFGIPPTRITVDESDGRNGKLYRARLIGLAQSEADDACRALRSRQFSCLVVQSKMAVAETPPQ